MNNIIKFLFNIKDKYLRFDEKIPFEEHNAHKTLKKHYNEVGISLQTRLANSALEGINNKIKVIKRTAYGFRNLNNFRLRILLAFIM